MKDEDKEVLQSVIDNLNYCEGYKEKLISFNKKFDPHKKVKFTNDSNKFLFTIDKAIPYSKGVDLAHLQFLSNQIGK